MGSLIGRVDECALLEGMVADVVRGNGRSIVLHGEAGIGKTALLEHLAGVASELTVLHVVGVEGEMELAFASLHQLCAPLLDRLAVLPAPQREALEIVFGIEAGDPPTPLLIGLAVLSLVSESAHERPMLCVVDDAQWLDRASALTLAFVARRLLAEPVGIVFAARETGNEIADLPTLDVRGLRDGPAAALLSRAVTFSLDEQVRDRIVAETRGNPLALLELPRGLTPAQLSGGFGTPGIAGLSSRIEQSFAQRLDGLSDDGRQLALLAAAEPLGDPTLLWRAAQELGIGAAAADDAQADGLLAIGEQVTFRHSLARSAVYGSASADERRAVHLALAAATDTADPDRRAWHLASATSAPDEEIALELERSAARARVRGGLAASAAFLERAFALTGDPARAVDRALVAAEASLGAGAFGVARGLLAAARAGRLNDLERARADRLQAALAFAQDRGGDAPLLLLSAARQLERLDVRLARDTHLEAWGAALFAGRLARGSSLLDVSRAAATAPPPADPPLASDRLLDGLALVFTEGRQVAAPVLRDAVTRFAGPDVGTDELLGAGWLASRAANLLWDYESGIDIAGRSVRLARESGALEALGVACNAYGQLAAFGGDLNTAALLIAEVDALREATGTRIAPHAGIVLEGMRGQEPGAAESLDRILADAPARGQGTAVQYALWAKAMLMNGLGRYEAARAAARAAIAELPDLYIAAWALSELVEAATRTGDADGATAALTELGGHVAGVDSDWALGLHARARALTSEGEPAFREAIERLARTRVRPDLARAHLVYGEWLRRAGRRLDARGELRSAHELFASMGMEAFAERARGELLATGERARRREAVTRDDLTPQERQIARLARAGLSNPEIAARLFLSPRTVEWHLGKVFAKLGIRSRVELPQALPRTGSELSPA